MDGILSFYPAEKYKGEFMRAKKSSKTSGNITKFPTKNNIILFPTKKSIVKSAVRHILLILLATVIIASAILINVNATSGTDAVITPLNSLKTLVIAIIGAVGIIILAKNVMEFAQAYQQQDSSTMNSALKGIVAGLLMAGISAVLGFLGF